MANDGRKVLTGWASPGAIGSINIFLISLFL